MSEDKCETSVVHGPAKKAETNNKRKQPLEERTQAKQAAVVTPDKADGEEMTGAAKRSRRHIPEKNQVINSFALIEKFL